MRTWRVKTLGNTHLVALRHIKRENTSLSGDVCRLKMYLHKLPLVMPSFQPFKKNPSNKSPPVNSRVSCQHSCIKIKIRHKLRITQRKRLPNFSQACPTQGIASFFVFNKFTCTCTATVWANYFVPITVHTPNNTWQAEHSMGCEQYSGSYTCPLRIG